jgi:acetyl esterase/lipase
MFDSVSQRMKSGTTVFEIGAEERIRENALREHFAAFWANTQGEPRAVYDKFVSACPMAEGIDLESLDRDGVHGWWVRPASGAPVSGRAILYIHGGGYVMGSAQAYRGFVSQLVARTEIPALVIDYPLAPEASLPAAPEAALTAWHSLAVQGFDRIAIVGDSAGGGLTLVTLAALAKQPLKHAPVAGVVFSPWTDLCFTGASMTDPAVTDPLIGYDYLQDCVRKYAGDIATANPLASPLYGDLKGLPPLLIQVGTDERLLDDSRQYAGRATQAGASVHLEIWKGMHHVFQLDVAHIESARIALDRAGQFLSDAFGRK